MVHFWRSLGALLRENKILFAVSDGIRADSTKKLVLGGANCGMQRVLICAQEWFLSGDKYHDRQLSKMPNYRQHGGTVGRQSKPYPSDHRNAENRADRGCRSREGL